jgi:O-acetyl-ADP-ribose deacetylase (regulator of RNase III)
MARSNFSRLPLAARGRDLRFTIHDSPFTIHDSPFTIEPVIEHKTGNLLKADAEALVNAVNCVGVMGKGIALQFKQAFPDNFSLYERACRAKQVRPGAMLIVTTGNAANPKYIINFPTKRHWRDRSRIEDIRTGLEALIRDVKRLEIKSIAIPALGCGNGGLDWSEVGPMIEGAFSALTDVAVSLYEPHETPNVPKLPSCD